MPTFNTNMKKNQYLVLREAKFARNKSRLKQLGLILVSLLPLKLSQLLSKIEQNRRQNRNRKKNPLKGSISS